MNQFTREWHQEYVKSGLIKHLIIFDSFDHRVVVEADIHLLRQVLSNLLTNSRKYSAAGSLIRIGLTVSRSKAIYRVTDQGIGIPEKDIPYLFDPFFRASNIENIHGTGLGLPLVKQIVELHRGEIAVESKLGEGTVFSIELPLAKRTSREAGCKA